MRPRRDQLFLRACAALGPEVARAVATARLFPGDDESDLSPGCAWLLAVEKSRSNAEHIAQALQSGARRNRANAVVGPPARALGKKVTLAQRRRAENAQALRSVGPEPDPLVVLQALEAAALASGEEAAVAGSAALLDAIQHAPGADLALRLRVTPRRGQQIRAAQRAALLAGQQDLFAEAEL